MIERVALAVFVFLAAFVAVGLWLPDTAHVERSIEIERPVITVFTLLNGFESFPAWSPWAERDPAARYAVSGPPAGVGARLEWSGDPRRVGSGSLEIVESRAPTQVRSRLRLQEQGEAETTFRVERVAGGARVTWILHARLDQDQGVVGSLLAGYFGLLLDRWIGADFERGLERFRQLAEGLPGADFSGLEVVRQEATAFDLLYVAVTEADAQGFAGAYGEISTFMATHGLAASAQPLLISHGARGGRPARVLAAIPVERNETAADERVRWGRSPTGPALRAVHEGPYDRLPETYARLSAWMAVHGFEPAGVSWEQYVSNPATTTAEERVTHVYVLLADPG
jgi:effector-binding domain-containing protein